MKSSSFIVFLLLIFTFSFSFAETEKVGVGEYDPLCHFEGDGWKGFEVDLMNKVQEIRGVEFEYVDLTDDQEKLETGILSDEIDISMCGFFHTLEREEKFDMIPFIETGYIAASITDDSLFYWDEKTRNRMLLTIFVLIGAGILLWLLESVYKKFDVTKNFLTKALFHPFIQGGGIENPIDGFNCAGEVSTTIGSGRSIPRTLLGNILFWPLAFWGIYNVGMFISDLNQMGSQAIAKYKIDNIYELQNLKVGTVSLEGFDLSKQYLEEKAGVTPVEYSTIDELGNALIAKEIDIMFYEAPLVERFASKHENVIISSGFFDKDIYGFIVKQGSEKREDITKAMIQLRKDGVLDELKRKWFAK